jgi:hypothetical protein
MADDDTLDTESTPQPTPQQQALYQRYANLDPGTTIRTQWGPMPVGLLGTMIGRYESGGASGDYDHLSDVRGSPQNATSLPTDWSGFPQWGGQQNVYGGTSHGSGRYQFEPDLWHEAANAMGLGDFSPPSQDAALNWTLLRYGTTPWHTNQQLAQAVQYYQRTGQVPPASLNFATNYHR